MSNTALLAQLADPGSSPARSVLGSPPDCLRANLARGQLRDAVKARYEAKGFTVVAPDWALSLS